MNACAACGAELSADDALCGSCGQPVEACAAVEPTDTGGSASAGAPPVASSGDYVPGDAPKHGFRLTPEPDRIAASASAVIEQAIVAAGIETDPAWLRHCQINWSSYMSFLATAAAEGNIAFKLAGKFAGSQSRMINRMLSPRIHGDYDPETSYYALRRCRWPDLPVPVIGMQTYAAALARTRRRLTGGTKTTTYPPSPLTNTVFAALPGSCGGDCAFTRASAEFVTNPEQGRRVPLFSRLSTPPRMRS